MKKFLASILIVVLLFSVFSCEKNEKDEVLKIVTTNFAAYDWTKNVIADAFTDYELTLIGGGADLHSFSPSAADIMKIADADIFIYVGGESDKWARDVELKEDAEAISLVDSLDKSRLIYDHDVVDEHVWLSPYNAQILCKEIEKAIVTLRPDYQVKLADTLEDYALKLLELEREYLALGEGMSSPAVMVADRFPFAYLMKDCGIGYYALFPTCSTDSEASFDKITSFAKTIDKTGIKYLAVTESFDKKLADSIIDNTKDKTCEIIIIDSMQTATEGDYINISKNNLSSLKEAVFEDK